MSNSCYLNPGDIKRLTETDDCTNFVKFLYGDFNENLNNPIYRGECPNYDTQMIVMTVCYAYCLLKFPILFMVFFYQKNRVNKISESIADTSHYDQNRNSRDEQHHSENNQSGPKNQGPKYMLDKDSIEELKTYETSIMMNIYVEMCMSFRDFFLFRGLGYFISYLYQVNFVYYSSKTEKYQCDVPSDFKCSDGEVKLFLSTADMCINRYPFYSLDEDNEIAAQYAIMYSYVIIWIILEAFAGSILFFNTQVLSYVNEGGKEPKSYNKTIKNFSIIFFFGQVITLSVLIFIFKIRLYFRFQSMEVLTYYLIWKSLGFMLLLDQFLKKKYLSKKLYIDIAYNKSVNWQQKELDKYKEAIDDTDAAEGLDPYIIQGHKLYLDIIHRENEIECKRKNDQQDKKINFSWETYIFFVLGTLFCGIMGYSLCLIHYAINQNGSVSSIPNSVNVNDLNSSSFEFGKYLNAQSVFWIGFIFCMLESAVFEIFNSVLLLHGYYLQLFEQIASPPDQINEQQGSSNHSQSEHAVQQTLINQQ